MKHRAAIGPDRQRLLLFLKSFEVYCNGIAANGYGAEFKFSAFVRLRDVRPVRILSLECDRRSGDREVLRIVDYAAYRVENRGLKRCQFQKAEDANDEASRARRAPLSGRRAADRQERIERLSPREAIQRDLMEWLCYAISGKRGGGESMRSYALADSCGKNAMAGSLGASLCKVIGATSTKTIEAV